MNSYYTNERNVQIVISLLKGNGIRKVIASPGTTNQTFVRSIQQDPWFEIYSAVDERSAAYMACGMAAEANEPIVISCTGATASRNYLPGLTEAYYRKLPVLALTSMLSEYAIGHLHPQVIDRRQLPNDVVCMSVTLPYIHTAEDECACVVRGNAAMLALKRHGGGPVHINLGTRCSMDFSVKELPPVRIIRRITANNEFPSLPHGNIAIFIGAHSVWEDGAITAIESFCRQYGAAVFCDQTSNYDGDYKIMYPLYARKIDLLHESKGPDLLIHIGEVSSVHDKIKAQQVWRISEDGEIRDTFDKLTYVFEMPERRFFEHYAESSEKPRAEATYYSECKHIYDALYQSFHEDDVPFSNIWMAHRLAPLIPSGCALHFGILSSLRAWSFFNVAKHINTSSNVGGFGIDGGISTLLGASLCNKDKLYFGIFGDLAFFYDVNSLGNRHVGNNVRILLVNNGKGAEFRMRTNSAYHYGDKADAYIAAAGHFGHQSRLLVRQYAENLGFEYMCADSKESFIQNQDRFLTTQPLEKSIIFEVFTTSDDECTALNAILDIDNSLQGRIRNVAKNVLSKIGK